MIILIGWLLWLLHFPYDELTSTSITYNHTIMSQIDYQKTKLLAESAYRYIRHFKLSLPHISHPFHPSKPHKYINVMKKINLPLNGTIIAFKDTLNRTIIIASSTQSTVVLISNSHQKAPIISFH